MYKLNINENLISWFLLFVIITLAAALRFYDIAGESYWLDEIIMLDVAQGKLDSIIQGGRPPAYIILAHFWIKIFGMTEAATRSLSALAGIASIPVIYIVGCMLFGRTVGIISGFLMAISHFQIYYSQDFRYYSVFVLMTLLSYLFLIRVLRSGNFINYFCYAVTTIILVYTHAFGVFIMLAQNLFFWFHFKRHKAKIASWIICQAIILIAISPYFIPKSLNAASGTAGPYWISDPSLNAPLITLFKFLGTQYKYPSQNTVLVAIAFFLIGTLLIVIWKGKQKQLASVKAKLSEVLNFSRSRNELLLLGFWLICPILLPLIFSKILRPMYVDRYTICASPALYLILGFAIYKIRNIIPEFISLGMLVILIAPALYNYYPRYYKPQWREAAAYVEENQMKADVIIVNDNRIGINRKSFQSYYRGNAQVCIIDRRLKEAEAITKALNACISGKERFWFILSKQLRPSEEFISYFLDTKYEGFHLELEKKFHGSRGYVSRNLSLYLFEVTSH